MNEVGERKPAVETAEFSMVAGLRGVHLFCGDKLPSNHQGLRFRELPQKPATPVTYGLATPKVGELLYPLPEPTLACAPRAGLADIEDDCAVHPFSGKSILKNGWILLLEPAADTFLEKRMPVAWRLQYRVDARRPGDVVYVEFRKRLEAGEAVCPEGVLIHAYPLTAQQGSQIGLADYRYAVAPRLLGFA